MRTMLIGDKYDDIIQIFMMIVGTHVIGIVHLKYSDNNGDDNFTSG